MRQRALVWLSGAVVILNLIDAMFTLLETSCGIAVETNPMMRVVLAASPVLFMVAKLGLVSLCTVLLWRLGHRAIAVAGLAGATLLYVFLLGYHLSAVPLLVAR